MIELNIRKLPTRLNIKFQDISSDNVLAKMAQETQTMAPSYEQNKAKICQIHATVNLPFKRPLHEGYKDLGTAHLDLPLDRVNLAPRQPDPAWTQNVPPGPDGRQRHLCAVWDMALEARGVQGTLRISFPSPIVVIGGSNLPEGQELVGMFAYRLVSGHWRVQTAEARIGEERTVTTAGVLGLNVVTGGEKRRPEWVDVAWFAMRGHVGRQRKGVVDVIDVEDDAPPTPSARKRKGRPAQGDTEPPPKAPRTATTAERAELAAGQGQRGAMHEWVE